MTKSPTTLAAAEPGVTQITVTLTADARIMDFLPMPNGGIITRTVYAQLEDDEDSGTC